ncbi:MAG: hypothetical protein NTV24_01985 [Candidatus Woesebacteria bacterium]|nr:hypothetical protein [Candidatus Woesebacteria bacterium]
MKRFINYYFIASVVILSVVLLFLFRRVYKIESFLATLKNETLIQQIDVCGDDCKSQINDIVSKAISTVSATTKTAVQKETATEAPSKKTAYIPLSGPITTTSTDWVDAAGTDVYIDLANDYGKNTYVSWEGFLAIANGNGQAFARLYDATHGIAVNGSEISTTNGSSTQVASGSLSLWAGRNLYRVQLKSLNSFVATFVSGRIKINY